MITLRQFVLFMWCMYLIKIEKMFEKGKIDKKNIKIRMCFLWSNYRFITSSVLWLFLKLYICENFMIKCVVLWTLRAFFHNWTNTVFMAKIHAYDLISLTYVTEIACHLLLCDSENTCHNLNILPLCYLAQ